MRNGLVLQNIISNFQANVFILALVFKISAVVYLPHLMFRFTTFTSITIKKPFEFLNTDRSSKLEIVTEMFSLELKPMLEESSCRHVTFHPFGQSKHN